MSMSVRGNRPPGGCRARIYIILYASRPRAACPLPARGTTGRVLVERRERFIFAPAEGGRAQAFPSFRVLRGKLSYMSAKTILYDRKNYKQARKNLLLDSFS